MAYTVLSVDKALTLLEVLAQHPGSGVTELAERCNSTKSQTFRLLYTLEQRGYVRKDLTFRTFTLGYRVLYIGDKAKQQTNLIHIAQPHLDELAEVCRENVHLIVREEFNSVCITMRESSQQLRLYAQVGRQGPLHAGGGSKVLLAYAPQSVKEAILNSQLETFTSATVTDPDELRHLLEKIAKAGYHDSENDLDEGAFSISAPIRDHTSSVVAALSIAGPVSRLNSESRKHHRELVVQYADRVSQHLGWEGTSVAPIWQY